MKIVLVVGLLIVFQLSYVVIEIVKFSIVSDKQRKQGEIGRTSNVSRTNFGLVRVVKQEGSRT